jgi:hypothetical protein
MEAKMQMTNLIEAGASEVQPKLPADYSAMKEKLIREARVAQAAAIRAAFATLIAAVASFATRLSHPPCWPSPEPEHGD